MMAYEAALFTNDIIRRTSFLLNQALSMQDLFFENYLICPSCKAALAAHAGFFECTECKTSYPIQNGIPVMIGNNNPAFTQQDFLQPEDLFFKLHESRSKRLLKKIQPSITLNNISSKNYAKLATLFSGSEKIKILIVGGSVDGEGIDQLKSTLKNAIWVESDVSFGPNTNIIFDAHQIPFGDGLFDLVIVQAVLEHVLDPQQCVAEIYRVLKCGGIVYAETPFMQQVHGGKYDFQRFTHLGHRRLFRQFLEKESGVIVGPGSALAWSARYFITSFANSKRTDRLLSYTVNFFVFWLKYFDLILNRRRGSIDAASGYYFMGEKQQGFLLSDRELLNSYRGFRY